MVEEPLAPWTQKVNIIPLILQLLIALRFYAFGNMQLDNGDIHSVCQGSISKTVREESKAIASLHQQFVKYPTSAEAHRVCDEFRQLANFPGVCGAIDCTHVKIKSPKREIAEQYRNRKTIFCINVQGVCDPNGVFLSFTARWPGSVHDSRIFDNSRLRMDLENETVPGILIGDAGYPCLRYLMIPLRAPNGAAEDRYQECHIKTRNPIERAFGVLKKRFYCLGLELRTKLPTSLIIISACFVLHNYAKQRNEEELDPLPLDDDDEVCNEINLTGNAHRRLLNENHFTTVNNNNNNNNIM